MAFSETVRKQICAEVDGFCSNPKCRAQLGHYIRGLSYPVGEACHIVAESADGPRGLSSLNAEERSRASNGIWLCEKCHGMIDDPLDWPDYPAPILHEWKASTKEWCKEIRAVPFHQISDNRDRRKVSLVDSDSLIGAENFLNFHFTLFESLHKLSYSRPRFRGGAIQISTDLEDEINLRARRGRRMGISWEDKWSTTYRCSDSELLLHMNKLIECTQDIYRPISAYRDQREARFDPPDRLGGDILNYISTWRGLQDCLKRLKLTGLQDNTY